MANEDEIKIKIQELEKQKSDLIERLKKINGRLRFKRYEQKALEPFLEQTKDVHIGSLRRQKKIIEFRISTQAYTPKMEREWIKEVKKIDEQLEKVKEVEKARRKKMFVEGDIAEAEKGICEIEIKLNAIREELKRLYDNRKIIQSIAKRGINIGGFKDDITIGDIGVIETK